MVQCLAAFMELCYIFRRNVITSTALSAAQVLLDEFHTLRQIFIEEGIRESISLPRQHALPHYITSIPLFGSPNGLCSSITESKHIKAVKEPWRRSSRFRALPQMLRTIVRLEKLSSLRRRFLREQLLIGTTASTYSVAGHYGNSESDSSMDDMMIDGDEDGDGAKGGENHVMLDNDIGPEDGPQALSSISLATTPGIVHSSLYILKSSLDVLTILLERKYPNRLHKLAIYIKEPEFPLALKKFLYGRRHPNREVPDDIDVRINFTGKIQVFHSAIARFYAPSDLCGAGGMYRQRIRCNPVWYGQPRRDTVFVVQDEAQAGMRGMLIARIHLLFSFIDEDSDAGATVPCALVSWYLPVSNDRHPDTGMWLVKPEGTRASQPVQVIPLKSIARGAHLLPNYGVGILPEYITHINALDEFKSYFVNPYIDHHCHEFLSD